MRYRPETAAAQMSSNPAARPLLIHPSAMRVLMVGPFEEWVSTHRDDVEIVKAATAAEALNALSNVEPKLMVVDPTVLGENQEDLVQRAESIGCSVIAADRQGLGVKIPGSTIQELEKHAILETLKAVGGSTSKAAKILGISVRKIQYRLRDWRMQASDLAPKRGEEERARPPGNHDAVH